MMYTTKELESLADGQGQIGIDRMRKALRWAARTLEAADAAVQAEYARATQAAATEREACAKVCETGYSGDAALVGRSCATKIRGRSNAEVRGA